VLTEKKLTTKRKKLKTLKKLALVSKENSLYQDENYSESTHPAASYGV